ncbi:hypothetical protein [Halomonas sp. OfavH-34-E]|uniref:hypothetical protein n=1 Tax=Halomonas sp. OfavH-34-E TaxID=2954491 RepID=UPI0020976560|nr:hypothetical protein [Halomonas sp. OfavH-34-E]MCO7217116.1 hypothetical protein [Halomonas sp. OfavH-34-E]
MTVNANPLIKDDPSDTIEEMCARLEYMSQWAEGDEGHRALQQDLQMMRGALRWLACQGDGQKNLAQSV